MEEGGGGGGGGGILENSSLVCWFCASLEAMALVSCRGDS